MTEVWAYLAIIAASILAITFNISEGFSSLFQAFHRNAAFQVGSIITTTGFKYGGFQPVARFSRTILVTLMFVGACAGSTGGRYQSVTYPALLKASGREILLTASKSVKRLRMEERVETEVIRSVNAYLALYMIIFVASVHDRFTG